MRKHHAVIYLYINMTQNNTHEFGMRPEVFTSCELICLFTCETCQTSTKASVQEPRDHFCRAFKSLASPTLSIWDANFIEKEVDLGMQLLDIQAQAIIHLFVSLAPGPFRQRTLCFNIKRKYMYKVFSSQDKYMSGYIARLG